VREREEAAAPPDGQTAKYSSFWRLRGKERRDHLKLKTNKRFVALEFCYYMKIASIKYKRSK